MFYAPKSRFRIVARYFEDPTGSACFSKSGLAFLTRFLVLHFYSFLRNRQDSPIIAFSNSLNSMFVQGSWVYKNRYRLVHWDVLRRYNNRITARLRGSLYKRKLFEYKKIKFFYFSLRDFQFRRFVRRGIPLYSRYNSHFLSFLELRVLTLAVRLGVYKTHAQGRQLLQHFGLSVNGKSVYHPNYSISPGFVLDLVELFRLGPCPRLSGRLAQSLSGFERGALGRNGWLAMVANRDYGSIFLPLVYGVHRLSRTVKSSDKVVIEVSKASALFTNSLLRARVIRGRAVLGGFPMRSSGRRNPMFSAFRLVAAKRGSIRSSLVGKAQLFSSFIVDRSRQLGHGRLARSAFFLLPKPFALISWPLKKVLVVKYPRAADLKFPFLFDPVLALSFISNR